MKINSFDIDGVIFLGPNINGVYPGPQDIIISGRSFEEEAESRAMLDKKGIKNKLYLNPLPFDQKTRESSGRHKANTINELLKNDIQVVVHFEDDDVQAAVIREECPHVHIIMLVHDLTEKENVRQLEY